ncbi:MAG: hypothetical protein BZ134_00155 [Methanosphaera sp. SHI1033]|nr:MAG: hypothetical protein BZ134_00155 [Methanosphaera sp. SHI1033]
MNTKTIYNALLRNYKEFLEVYHAIEKEIDKYEKKDSDKYHDDIYHLNAQHYLLNPLKREYQKRLKEFKESYKVE